MADKQEAPKRTSAGEKAQHTHDVATEIIGNERDARLAKVTALKAQRMERDREEAANGTPPKKGSRKKASPKA